MITCPKKHSGTSTYEEIEVFLEDDHVHMAVVVGDDGRLVTTIERSDLISPRARTTCAQDLGTVAGRVVGPMDDLATVTALLLSQGRRRMAVVDDSGQLVGLLCLKKDGSGYCSDQGVADRRSSNP
jgi:CBS-domain-containing membrane protein